MSYFNMWWWCRPPPAGMGDITPEIYGGGFSLYQFIL